MNVWAKPICCFLLAWDVFADKSSDNFMDAPFNIILFFSLWCLYNSLFIYNFLPFCLWYVLCESVYVHHVWDRLCVLYLYICFLLQLWELFSHNYFKHIFDPSPSLSPLFGTPLMQMLEFLAFFFFFFPRNLSNFFHFVKVCFSFCCSD